jgi:methyl-accepting chemotaxis protein
MVLSAAFYTNFFRLDQANSWNVHSYQVIDESRGIVESLVNMER